MNFLKKLSRRKFIHWSIQLGATGLVSSCAKDSSLPKIPKSTKTAPWQIGCYTRPWGKFDYRQAFDAIAEAGFKYVGLMTTKSRTNLIISVSTTLQQAQQVKQEASARGLEIVSVYGGGIPVNRSLQAGIDGLKKLIDNCAACDGKNLLMCGTNKKELQELYFKAIAESCDYAEAKGIGISLKPHGPFNATALQCRRAVETVGHKNFRIWYDPGNILYYSDGKLDPAIEADTVSGLVIGMCIKDYTYPKNVFVTPGTGQVDFKAVLERLNKGGFNTGPLVVECLEQGDLKKLLSEAKKARQFLEQLTGQKA